MILSALQIGLKQKGGRQNDRDNPPHQNKTVGIGLGSAMLCGKIGLEIYHGNWVHGTELPPSLTVTTSELLSVLKSNEPLLVLKESPEVAPRGNEERVRPIDFIAILHPAVEKSTIAVAER
ncbi:MAG: hypothetical protein KDA72_21865 [Planctomycetales bacterium]|nr:hypothetical protein [Planctomycetales bacterium]